jgi:hypothetical protein
MVALPLFKLGALAIRQVTKPIVASVVRYSADHRRFRVLCITMGRISYGLTGAYEEAARTEVQQQAGASDTPATPPPQPLEATAAAAAEDPPEPSATASSSVPGGGASALGSSSGGSASSSSPRQPFRTAALMRPIDAAREAYNRRFRAPIPTKLLVDAGAFVIVELTVYLIAAVLLYVEYRSSSATSIEKERIQNERIAELEKKVNELARHQKLAELSQLQPAPKGWIASLIQSASGGDTRPPQSELKAEGNRDPAAVSVSKGA